MKKFIAAFAAAGMLAFSGTAAYAAPYQPTTETDVKPVPKDNVKPGKKSRIVVKPRVQGDAGQCTGSIVVFYKSGKEVLRNREKPVDNRVAFNGKVPGGTTKIVFLYQRGKKDPCDKSKSSISV